MRLSFHPGLRPAPCLHWLGTVARAARFGLLLAASFAAVGLSSTRADQSVEVPLKRTKPAHSKPAPAKAAKEEVREVTPPSVLPLPGAVGQPTTLELPLTNSLPPADIDHQQLISPTQPDLKPIDLEDLLAPSNPDELVKFLAKNYKPGDEELSLDDAIAIALKNNHGLNQQRLAAESAVQDVKVNWTALRPQIDASGKASWAWTNTHPTPQVINIPGQAPITIGGAGQETGLVENVALSLTQRIYDFGLTTNLVDLAKARLAIQHYAVSQAEQQLVNDVTVAYLNYNLALGQARIRWSELRLAEEELREAQAQFDAGTAPRLDVIRAESAVQEAHGAVIQAETQFGNAAAQFFALLGVEDKRYVPLLIPAAYLQLGDEPPALDDAVKQALAQRPELDLEQSTLLAGQETRKLATNRPILNAFGNWGYTLHAGAEGPYNSSFGVQIQWPVYTGGKDKVDRKKADIDIAGISEGLQDLQAKIELDATTAWNRVYAARNNADVAQKDLALSVEGLRAAFLGYQAGVTRYLDLSDALNQNVTASLNYLGALAEVRLANIDLQRAMGFPQGYPEDTRPDFDPSTTVEKILALPSKDATAAAPAPAATTTPAPSAGTSPAPAGSTSTALPLTPPVTPPAAAPGPAPAK